jgi:hypothetical protein
MCLVATERPKGVSLRGVYDLVSNATWIFC